MDNEKNQVSCVGPDRLAFQESDNRIVSDGLLVGGNGASAGELQAPHHTPDAPSMLLEAKAVIRGLEDELARVNAQLRTITAEHEVANEAMTAKIKQLTSELILSEQTERQRISQILHDDLQQLLFAFQMRVKPLILDLRKEHAVRLVRASTLIDRALNVTRALTDELSSPELKREDFTESLAWLGLRMEEMHGLKVDVEAAGPVHLPDDLRTLLCQLVRELLFNVVKHASIDRARVRLLPEENRLILLVEDGGSGFDMAKGQEPQPTSHGGFGLRNVRQRLDLFGGHLKIDATPGHGTRAILLVPLGNERSRMDLTLPGDKNRINR